MNHVLPPLLFVLVQSSEFNRHSNFQSSQTSSEKCLKNIHKTFFPHSMEARSLLKPTVYSSMQRKRQNRFFFWQQKIVKSSYLYNGDAVWL